MVRKLLKSIGVNQTLTLHEKDAIEYSNDSSSIKAKTFVSKN